MIKKSLKTKGKLITVIALLAMVMVAVVGCNGKKENKKASSEEKVKTGSTATEEQKENEQDKTKDETKTNKVAFYEGVILGNVYKNEWLGVQVKAPEGYEYQLPLLNFNNTKCGFIYKEPKSESLFYCYFYDITSAPDTTQESLLNKAREYIMKESTYEKLENGTQKILDLEYMYEHAKTRNKQGSDVYTSIYMAKFEEKIVVFCIMNAAGSIEDNKNIIDTSIEAN